ncbi:MAG: carbamoyltransferase HypF [Chlorobiales bacterium]|nr:carbamoyltransferase HypF [Chlorobiales bacterium]
MDTMVEVKAEKRLRLFVNGVVQGVGFRPFVYRLAKEAGFSGFIRNTASGVCIEVQSSDLVKLRRFCGELRDKAPPLARISSFEVEKISPEQDRDFFIITSDSEGTVRTMVSPDVAICKDCRSELLDVSDRRHAYPFINCTNCGPRYTIVEKIPYDRPYTSMKKFEMCSACDGEYHDPMDRRFHAQPNACPDCGPALHMLDADGEVVNCADPLEHALGMLQKGLIVAVKGIGGYHLAVNAFDDAAILRLRKRKGREEKPFALMARDIETTERYCMVNEKERQALRSPEAPVVLLKKKGSSFSGVIAPGNDRLGMMLPYTPLHVLMMELGPRVLVMTSANCSDEPIVIEESDAITQLNGIADGYLVHNRPIYLRCDDSVTVHLAGKLRQIRRSRGYAPAPVALSSEGPPVFAAGAEIKNTVCLLKGADAILSQHIGDLKNYEAYTHFMKVADHLQEIFQVSPELFVCDMHPAYLSTRWALEQKEQPLLQVQHHHAHLASCLAENRCEETAVGVILDGAGYGIDGTGWGGEVLIGNAAEAFRFAWFEPVPLPGGDAAVFHPWKVAAGYLYHTYGDLAKRGLMGNKDVSDIAQLLEKGINSPMTSSCGRLFDAVAGIIGLRDEITYEGQAAVELMHAAGGLEGKAYSWETVPADNDRWLLSVSPLIRDIVADVQGGEEISAISRNFHVTMVHLLYSIVNKAVTFSGARNVVLSGGVFQNALLFEGLVKKLEQQGYTVLTHAQVPCNDGGISLGQAVIGREYLKGKYKGVI